MLCSPNVLEQRQPKMPLKSSGGQTPACCLATHIYYYPHFQHPHASISLSTAQCHHPWPGAEWPWHELVQPDSNCCCPRGFCKLEEFHPHLVLCLEKMDPFFPFPCLPPPPRPHPEKTSACNNPKLHLPS
uniref:Uncharacterized protein n=1 Tax=Crocodylus porosus TaxID=8502 RepID=A0A7M4EA06_CROPO